MQVTSVTDDALSMVKIFDVGAASVVGVAGKGIAGGRRPGVGVIGVVGRGVRFNPPAPVTVTVAGISGEPVYVKGPPTVPVVVDVALSMVKVFESVLPVWLASPARGIAGGRRPGVGVIGVVRPPGSGSTRRRRSPSPWQAQR